MEPVREAISGEERFNPTDVRTVDILRPDNLGDVVLFSGALRHIRARFPGAAIRVWLKRYAVDLLELCPYVDQIRVWEPAGLARLPAFRGKLHLESALRLGDIRLQGHHTDLLLCPVRSAPPAVHATSRAIRAPVKLGVGRGRAGRPGGEVYTSVLALEPYAPSAHELTVTRDFLELIGISVTLKEIRPEFWTGDADRAWAAAAVPREDGAITLAVAPGVSSAVDKQLPLDRYAEVLGALADRRFSVVLFGSAAERGACGRVARSLAQHRNVVSVTDLAGRSTVRQFIEGLRRCDAVLTVDTAALHLATALDKPTVGIVGGGHFGRFYPWGDPARQRIAKLVLDCYGCGWDCPFATKRCISELPTETVIQELNVALEAVDRLSGDVRS